VTAQKSVYWDPFDRTIAEDPYPIYKRMRAEARIVLEESLRLFPKWEIDWDRVALSSTSTMQGWETLPVSVG
jgi:hypothetical protein